MWSIGLRERGGETDVRHRRMDAGPGAGAAPQAMSMRARPAAPRPWPDPRRLSPRQMADLGHRLYIAGHLGFDDSRLLSCQPELHPDYATTVARLPGRRGAADAPRDHIGDWQRRLAFALRYTPDDDERIGRIRRIVAALDRLAAASSSPGSFRMRE